jgi:hypothetical protein
MYLLTDASIFHVLTLFPGCGYGAKLDAHLDKRDMWSWDYLDRYGGSST